MKELWFKLFEEIFKNHESEREIVLREESHWQW